MPDAIRSVFLRHIVDDSPAIPIRNVRIDIRHRNAFRIQKTFKKESEFQRVDIRNANDISDDGTRSRTAPRSNRNSVFSRPVDKIPNDKQVTRHIHIANTIQFLIDAIADFRPVIRIQNFLIRIPSAQTLVRQINQVGIRIAAMPTRLRFFHDSFDSRLVFVHQSVHGFPFILCAVFLCRIFKSCRESFIVFVLHRLVNFFAFFGFQKILGNRKSGPEIITDTCFHHEIAAFGDFNRIFKSRGTIRKQLPHFFFAAVIKLIRRESLILKFLEFFDQRNTAKRFVRIRIRLVYIMHVPDSNQFPIQFFGEGHRKKIQRFLRCNAIIAKRQIKMLFVKNFTKRFHISFGQRFSTGGHIHSITAKIIASDGNQTFFVRFNDA